MKPSPQTLGVQSESQVVEFPLVSHCSPNAGLVNPSPHTGAVQFASQVMVDTPTEPVSQVSATGEVMPLTMPSPQTGALQSASHVEVFTPPESHCSPAAELVKLSPHEGVVQLASQVALEIPTAPGSHCSMPIRAKPSPQ